MRSSEAKASMLEAVDNALEPRMKKDLPSFHQILRQQIMEHIEDRTEWGWGVKLKPQQIFTA